ncbi:hypothetical protein ACI6PS_02405 [Flavobacterium sp. PLA-1-15]|uniref:hypothetical protein n=1 Tax=Flavobacterium sp. PLA-1-15 TaxID=3380533 RepID=UPI003B7ACBEB
MSFKFIPMICATSVVQSLLENRKSQTRRLQGLENIDPRANEIVKDNQFPFEGKWISRSRLETVEERYEIFDVIKCPYGEVGDVLWVRETFYEEGFEGNYVYKAPNGTLLTDYDRWKPSIHMPKEAARLFYKITSIHVERLQNITEEDAIAEGVVKHSDYGSTGYVNYLSPHEAVTDIDAVWSFGTLWESIYGRGSWLKNPWVWVIKFEKIEQPENFLS